MEFLAVTERWRDGESGIESGPMRQPCIETKRTSRSSIEN
jgi:hypothetical protein